VKNVSVLLAEVCKQHQKEIDAKYAKLCVRFVKSVHRLAQGDVPAR
jgi:hypothetical protein